MPKRPAIEALPDAVKKWLDKALAEGNFSGYEQLEVLLKERGFQIGKSSIHRYGQKLERKLAAIKASTQAAAAIAEAAPDDADLRSAAVISLVQTEIFEVLVNLQEANDENIDQVTRVRLLSAAAKNIATLSRASVNQKKWQVAISDRTRTAADAVEKIAQKGGLTPDTVDAIRKQILGIAT